MDVHEISTSSYCYCCLSRNVEKPLGNFFFQKSLKSLLKVDKLVLCYICKKVAENAEKFIQNVETAQKILDLSRASRNAIENLKLKIKPPTNLSISCKSEGVIEVIGQDPCDNEEKIKIEVELDHVPCFTGQKGLKQEKVNDDLEPIQNDLDETANDLDQNANDLVQTANDLDQTANGLDKTMNDLDQNTNDIDQIVSNLDKIANDLDQIADDEENVLNNIEDGYELDDDEKSDLLRIPKKEVKKKKTKGKRKNKKAKGVITKAVKSKNVNDVVTKRIKSMKNVSEEKEITLFGDSDITKVARVCLTLDECMRERACKLMEDWYVLCDYKCDYCIKGFRYKPSFDKHMELHTKEKGDYECDVCKSYFVSKEKLSQHKKKHFVRYKCMLCGLIRNNRVSIDDHIATTHDRDKNILKYKCSKCEKPFRRESSLRKHVYSCQSSKVKCIYCSQDYASKESLKIHLLRIHPKNVLGKVVEKTAVCNECGMAFYSSSELRKHSVKHTDERRYYCVECDKSFKTNSSLQQHLKTVSAHVTPANLKYPCSYCSKKFSTKGHVERHMNEVHLNYSVKFHCDHCGKSYTSKYKLTYHVQQHKGAERLRNFACKVCHKRFYEKRTLNDHTRTHTGLKPFHCPECSASFSQYGSLYNHKKLVHNLPGNSKLKAQKSADIQPE